MRNSIILLLFPRSKPSMNLSALYLRLGSILLSSAIQFTVIFIMIIITIINSTTLINQTESLWLLQQPSVLF